MLVLPWLAEGINAEESLSKLLGGDIKPITQKLAVVPDMLAVSQAAGTPKKGRLIIRGTIFGDFYEDMFLGVWERWCLFTSKNEDMRSSGVIWDVTEPEKICYVAEEDTAMPVRSPQYWFAVQGRCNNPASDSLCDNFASELVTFVRETNKRHLGKDYGLWMAMCRGDEKPEDVFGGHLPRLRCIKAHYDPSNVWKKGFTIEPLSHENK